MLSIQKVSVGGAKYYQSLAREDYYLNGGEPPGRWHGNAAGKLGLHGDVERAHFERLFLGFHPHDQTPLVQNAGRKSGHQERVPGWDLTFSAPKSVSVLWALAPEETRAAIARAHEESVRAALTIMEDLAGFTRRGKGGAVIEKASLCFALFEHGTSRAQDPQLHTHAICFNLAFRADGTTGAIRSNELFEHKMAVGALYRCHLASILTRELHLPVRRTDSHFEIEGIDQNLIEQFSTRRKEVLAHCEQRGSYSAIEAEKAALITRSVKQHVAREILFDQWRQTGLELGWNENKFTSLKREELARRDWSAEVESLARKIESELRESARKPAKTELLESVAREAQALGLRATDVMSAALTAWTRSEHRQLLENARQNAAVNDSARAAENVRGQIDLKDENRVSRDASEKERQCERSEWATNKRSQAPLNKADTTGKQRQSERSEPQIKPEPPNRRKLRKEFAVARIRFPEPRYGRSVPLLDLRLFNIEFRGKRLFPKAPSWSPLRDFKLPTLTVRSDHTPTRMVRRWLIPLQQSRHVAAQQIRDAIQAAFRTGAKFVWLDNQPVKKLQSVWSEGKQAARKLRRPRVLIAGTNRELWRGLMQDWSQHGLTRPDENLLLTQTRATAERLNADAQKARKREGRIGLRSINVHGVNIHLNDRVRFETALLSNRIKLPDGRMVAVEGAVQVGDLGTVTGVKSDRYSVRLDRGWTVEIPLERSPELSLAYALSHEDAVGLKPKRAFILFEANWPEQEYLAIHKHAPNARVQAYAHKDHAGFFTQEGLLRLKARAREQEESRFAEAVKNRPYRTVGEFERDFVSGKHRRSEDHRQIQETRRRQEEERRRRERSPHSHQQQPSHNQSAGHSHSH